jgi:THAP4-like, heme-binding beta-barrel domain
VLALHPDLAEIAFLLGTWRGEGEGEWPGTDPFRFGEELAFEHVGDAYLLHTQRSWSLENDEEPIHLERGFLRPAGPGRVELVLAHPLGMAEVAEGTVSDRVIDVTSTSVALAGTASGVTELRRRIELEGDELRYELHMAMRETPLTSHIRSRLRRV